MPRRPASVPNRRCVGCGRSLPKADLLRLALEPAGDVRLDPDATREGRGAYVCGRPECAEAVGAKALGRSFRASVRVQPELIELIREWQRSASIR